MRNLRVKTTDIWVKYSGQITLMLSLLALIIFIARGLYYIEHQIDNMDEGTYLIKGRYFLDGTYKPYEEGGPITNKGIFSFLILGFSQLIAPGLRSGRLFALLLSTAMLVGMWLLIRRMSSQTWAAGILLLFSLNGFWVSMYTRAITQCVCAALITFCLLCITQKTAKTWQLCTGMLLAAVTIMTRQNLLPFFILAIVYIIWQFGLRKTWLPILVSVGFFLLINAIYWPEMYYMMWKPYVGGFIRDLNALFGLAAGSAAKPDIGTDFVNHTYKLPQLLWVIFNTIAVYIVPVLFSLFFLITANWKKAIRSDKFKSFAFIFINFNLLFVMHVMAVLDNHNILFSLPIYPGFFLPLGLIVIPCCYEWMSGKGNFFKAAALIPLIITACTGVGLYIHRAFSGLIMNLQVPRIRSMQILPGTTDLWRMLENKFHWGYNNIEFITAAALGMSIGIVFILICAIFWMIRRKKLQISFTRLLTVVALGTAVLLSPSYYLAGMASTQMCEESTIDRLENVGKQLSSMIPAGSLLYWEYHSPVVLLYVNDVRLFPAQLNAYFYKREGGEEEALLGKNLWNDEIAASWLQQADYIALSETAAVKLEPLMESRYPGLFDKLGITDNLTPCTDRSYLHIYRNTHPSP